MFTGGKSALNTNGLYYWKIVFLFSVLAKLLQMSTSRIIFCDSPALSKPRPWLAVIGRHVGVTLSSPNQS